MRELTVLALVPLLWLAPALRPGRVLSSADMLLGSYLLNQAMPSPYRPSNPLIGDTVMQMVPWRQEAVRQLRSGVMPFWNPHAFAGSPLLGNSQSGVFDLLSFPYRLVREPIRATVWVMLLRLWTAGLGTWLLARRLGASPFAAVGAAVIYQSGGFTQVWLMYPHVASSAWFPWALLAAEVLAVQSGARNVAWLAVALSAVVFGGHVEAASFAAVAAAAYFLLRRLQERGISARAVAGGLGAAGAVAVLTAALSAPQTVPFLDALSQGMLARGRLAGVGVVPPRLDWFVLAVFPFLFGRPLAGEVYLANAYTNFCEQSGAYASVLGLALAILGIVGLKRRSPWSVIALMGVTAWSFAASLPPVSWLVPLVPVFNIAAAQRAVFVALLAIGLLAARGIDLIADGTRRVARIALGVGLAVLAFLGLAHALWLLGGAPGYMSVLRLAARSVTIRAWFAGAEKQLVESFAVLAPSLGRQYAIPWALAVSGAAAGLLLARRLGRAFPPACIAVVLFDLAAFGRGFNPAIPVGQAYPRTDRIEEVRRVADGGRTLVLNWGLYPNAATYYGLDDINGYDAIGRQRLTELLRLGCTFPGGPVHWPIAFFDCYYSPVLDILSVQAVASAKPLANPHLEFVSHTPSGGYLYRNLRAMPRAFVPEGVVRAENLEAAIDLARRSPPNPHTTALVEGRTGDHLSSGLGRVGFERPSADRIVLDAAMERGGVVVVSEAWDPGWRATVDGSSTPVYPCDVALMAVSVPTGAHRVELRFRPRGWAAAAAAFAGAVAIVALLVGRRRPRVTAA